MQKLRSEIPRIFISLMNAYSTHADILRGILDYTRSHTPWSFELRSGRRDEPELRDTDWTEWDGAVVNNATPELLEHIRTHSMPVVLVNADHVPSFPGCVLCCDNLPIARAAADFLLAREFASYAFVDTPGVSWSAQRGDIFTALVTAAGMQCARWRTGPIKTLAQHIADMPKPLGVFATDDIRARTVLDACRMAGCEVPDDVAILGVDNDETLCEFSSPTISSISRNTHAAGFRAAEILDSALRGEIAPADMPDSVYTLHAIVERQSTARSFAHDSLVRRCNELIAANFTTSVGIDQLAQMLHVSRRTLEMRYRAATHSTIAAEIMQMRITRAKKLLSETTHSQEHIAAACGFHDASHLGATFRKHFNLPPSAFRAT